ncbi:dsRBD fold-containing protein [Mycolicibacterium smegmatis]|uniref:dsRBD fold-containing protein n=1 Tax=Mycolicibacterium smegmatis TaxID=1772 RepID=UPI0013035B24|nr:dsRBD fold-containing protein [Mycolicibacterium smegmatis]
MTEHDESTRKNSTVQIVIDEHEGRTRVQATLQWRGQAFTGTGLARCNPADQEVAEIGDELALARALADLAARLKSRAVHDIEGSTHHPVTALR